MDAPHATYSLDEITPETMVLIDEAMRRDAAAGRIFDGRNLVDTYACDTCATSFAAVAVHVGVARHLTNCSKPGCRGTAVSGGQENVRPVDEHGGPIDYEWYRPLTERECETEVSLIETEVSSLVDDPLFPREKERREWYVETAKKERAKHILTGGLLRRPRATR